MTLEAIKFKLAGFFSNSRLIIKPLAVGTDDQSAYIFMQGKNLALINSYVGDDSFNFKPKHNINAGQPVNNLVFFIHKNTRYFLVKDGQSSRIISVTSAFDKTVDSKPINAPSEKIAIVSDFLLKNKAVMYFGERSINLAFSNNLIDWDIKSRPVLVGDKPIEISGVFETEKGLLVVYLQKEIVDKLTSYSVYLALFDKKNPDKFIWKTEKPIWSQQSVWPGQTTSPIGTIFRNNQLVSYWYLNGGIVYGVIHSGFKFDPDSINIKKPRLKKHENNPILSPRKENHWEAFNTFNPAALHADGKVHILYRAQGFDYVSSVGYAASADGIIIDERLDHPVYSPLDDFENNQTGKVNYDFMSGGGFGGCEDPRITLIGKRVYMTYVAFDGWSPPRLALTSISLNDFLDKKWLWTKPVLISPPGIVDKSGCLLPEKIKGKYVFFHRVFPNILIDYVDDLNFDGKHKWLKGQYQIKVRKNMWDSRKIGAGAPPIKTKDGWLLIYYGVDDRDASKYHIGAMLLDLQNPTKVLHRTNKPILEPTEDYENTGFKPGIAYPCGAVGVNDRLLVYYGGADSVVCVAGANLDFFLEQMKSKEEAELETIKICEINYRP